MIEVPFPYGSHVTGKNFIGRTRDANILSNLLAQGEQVVIYEPPKTGKTSLVQQALLSMRMSGQTFLPGQLSLLGLRSVEEFLVAMGDTLLRMVAFQPSEYAALLSRHLSGTAFRFDETLFTEKGTLLSLPSHEEVGAEDIRALLELPFRLAAERGERIVLLLDEFQCVNRMERRDDLLRGFSEVLAREAGQNMASLIFCGSAVNAMRVLFERSALLRPQVERVRLSPLDMQEVADHVHKGFLSSGKVVEKDRLLEHIRPFKGNMWYVNHFASICDSMTRGYVMEPVLQDAMANLLGLHDAFFRSIVQALTTHQLNFLRAVLDGVTRFSTAQVIRQYGFHSSANVKRVKDALMLKEVLAFDGEDETPTIIDPLFEVWLRRRCFCLEGE